ncbi:N-acetyltransferase [Curtobacterium sp. MCPF17_047]|uniref:GNAT family N-acetyltransferase n=1 Tax=unclassified Curtobacterium TaxID=257496 RepID=UPI000DA9B607|nr:MULTISPECIES: GNAT family N-acetyltransferase [unclassified Curtobacterium]PZE60365.1 N-acetyltransferase [Curtobacterium sp. MCPF17_001]PZF67804.1 N-acetyltransferase [Curtobacterium sp. MCPF17_047]
MILRNVHVVLEPISPELARRIVARDERPGDDWHPEYPYPDELDPLRSLADAPKPDPDFTMYMIRRTSDGLAVGGFGFFGPPDEQGVVEFGYGLVPAARGKGLATEAVKLALERARDCGATVATADTAQDNDASQRVLVRNGFTETGRRDSLIFYQRALAAR